MNRALVVDADGHVVEPPEMLNEYIEPKFRDRIPKYVKDEKGREWWEPRDPSVSDAQSWFPRERTLVTCLPNSAGARGTRCSARISRGLAGAWDPHARIRDMDSEGIDVAVLIPPTRSASCVTPRCKARSTGVQQLARRLLQDLPEAALRSGGSRLQDVDGAARELRRCVKELGFVGVFLRPTPTSRTASCTTRSTIPSGGKPRRSTSPSAFIPI